MTHFLVATSSVHVTAAAADYLQGRLDPTNDEVTVVARSRLAAVTPTTETVEGEPTEELLAAVSEHDPGEVIVGPHRGVEGATGPGSTVQSLLSSVDRPIVVVPLPDL